MNIASVFQMKNGSRFVLFMKDCSFTYSKVFHRQSPASNQCGLTPKLGRHLALALAPLTVFLVSESDLRNVTTFWSMGTVDVLPVRS